MDMEQMQRTDITKVVEEHSKAAAASGPARAPDHSTAAPSPKPPKTPSKEATPTSAPWWYVVIDEIVEGTVTFEAWPWPDVDPATHYMRFDLNQTRNRTVDLVDLQDKVNTLRAEAEEDSETASRPLRIGDVFRVEATKIEKLSEWRRVHDETHDMRREAQAALHAMAAPVLDPGIAAELEKLARISKEQQGDTGVMQTSGTTASPTV
jgi:hypothetical protein